MNNYYFDLIKDFKGKEYAGLEFKPVNEIVDVQEKLLLGHINYTVQNSLFYRKLFELHEIDPASIRNVYDLSKIPYTTKDDLTGQNRDFIACPEEEIADICLTSATTGENPTIMYQSFSDLARLACNEERALEMIGVDPTDTVVISAAMDRCFMAGLAYYLGGLKLGAKMVRAGSGNAASLWQTIKTTGATVVIGVPSLMKRAGLYAIEMGDNPAKTGVKKLVAIGEAIRDFEMNLLPSACKVEKMWGAPLYSTYASTEMATAFCECNERNGGHLRPELMAVEIIDEKGVPVLPGEKGEVVVTPFGVRGMPLLRFRTGDISFLLTESCGCGRQTPRLGPILGRKNQMLKLKGTTVFPSAILAIVENMDDIIGAYIEVERNDDGCDKVGLFVTTSNNILPVEEITEKIRASVRVVPDIKLITEEKLISKIYQSGKRKKVTFFDLR